MTKAHNKIIKTKFKMNSENIPFKSEFKILNFKNAGLFCLTQLWVKNGQTQMLG